MSVQVSVNDETYIHVSNGGWDRFLVALLTTCGLDAFPGLHTRDVYCDISAARCAELGAWADVMRARFVADVSDPFVVGIYDDMAIAFHAGDETGAGVSIS